MAEGESAFHLSTGEKGEDQRRRDLRRGERKRSESVEARRRAAPTRQSPRDKQSKAIDMRTDETEISPGETRNMGEEGCDSLMLYNVRYLSAGLICLGFV